MTIGVPERSAQVREPTGDPTVRIVAYLVVGAVFVAATVLAVGIRTEGDISDLLKGPDDYMHLVQTIDWLDGQGWTDTVQRRLNPPHGVAMHWSRLADIPAAAVIRVTEPWFGRTRAVYLAATFVPPFLGALFAASFLWAAVSLLPGRPEHVPVLMVGTPVYALLAFLPGRVDHHGIQLALTTLIVGLLARSLEPGGSRAAGVLGIVGGASLAVGLETLPFVGAAAVILGLDWTLRGGESAKRLAIFGAAASATTLALLPLTVPSSEWMTVVCDRMSLPHASLAAVALAVGTGTMFLARLRPAAAWSTRLAAAGGIGLAGLALVATVFPQCAGSPYASLSAEIRYWFKEVEETASILELFRATPGVAVSFIVTPLCALAFLTWQRVRSDASTEPLWIANLVFVLVGVGLLIWQLRAAPYAGLVSSLALVPFAATVNERADRLERTLARLGVKVCVPMFCVAAIVLPQRISLTDSLPATKPPDPGCEVHAVLGALTDPEGLGAERRIIAAPIDKGPEILLRTRHAVLAGPYHRNAQGLADNRLIFAGTEEQALATVRARGVDAVLFCRKYVRMTTHADRPAFLNDRLGAGRPPWWLIPVAHDADMGLYRVHPAASAPPGLREGAQSAFRDRVMTPIAARLAASRNNA